MIDISLSKDKEILIWTHIGEITEFDLIGAIDKTKTFSTQEAAINWLTN